jgi:hypothetical protein
MMGRAKKTIHIFEPCLDGKQGKLIDSSRFPGSGRQKKVDYRKVILEDDVSERGVFLSTDRVDS